MLYLHGFETFEFENNSLFLGRLEVKSPGLGLCKKDFWSFSWYVAIISSFDAAKAMVANVGSNFMFL